MGSGHAPTKKIIINRNHAASCTSTSQHFRPSVRMLPDQIPQTVKLDPIYVKRASLKSDLYQPHKATQHLKDRDVEGSILAITLNINCLEMRPHSM
jgi:hypothetical protein